ncbi:MAG TPA: AAA family ATPase [Stellaceae bacterium]|nr:AAA family ATPase [Stellaceae bacterium]
MDVADWLRELGLEQYERAFRTNEIDERVLPSLTAEDLKDLGVTLVGHRRRLLDAIAALASPLSNPPLPGLDPGITGEGRVGVEAERRQLTVMFCDLVGSTALSTRFDPEDLRELIGAYHRAVADTVARFDGFVAKYMGDGVLIYFGYPQAHEDDAERAVGAGLAVIEAVGQLPARQDLRVRLGIATGLAVVGDLIGAGAAQERGVVGETPNLAARLQALAAPNTLVIAEATRRQIGGLFDLGDLGPQALAGFAVPQPAWRVLGESGMLSRFEALRSGTTPLVGRSEELDLLLRGWEQSKTGEGRVVLLSGEPGIGKSRLTAALYERIEHEPHTRLRYFCSPYHQDSALHPVILQLERAANFVRDDGPETKLDKFAALLEQAAEIGDISLLVELLSLPGGDRFAPLDLSPQRKKERTLAALRRQLQGLARTQPVLMIFEDLHWIDPTSREFLDIILPRIDHLPVLLVATFRPEFQPPWSGQPHVAAIALDRLGRSDGAAMVQRLAGNAAALLPQDVIAEIVERTDGVPLFVEEMTKAVLEAGAERGREIAESVPSIKLGVPATLQASLMARLDRLGPATKGVAQIGAAIGREFSYELAAAVSELSEERFRDALQRLVAAGLVFQRGAPPAAEYLFKHALVQDTAYGTLLRGPRQALHERIGQVLEERYPSLVETQPEIAARHFGEALLVDEAVSYWHRAGKLSVSKSAVREAVAQLRRGLSLLDGATETRERKQLALDVQVTLIAALMGAKGYADPEVIEAVHRARQLITETGGAGTLLHFSVLYGIWGASYVAGAAGDALDYATEFLALARSQPTTGPLLIGHRIVGTTMIMLGEHGRALSDLQTAAALYREDDHRELAFRFGQDIGAPAYCYLALALWHNGYPDQAFAAAERALAHARQFGHLHTLAYTLFHTSIVAVLARRFPELDAMITESVALASEHGFPLWAGYGLILQGWTVGQTGDAAAGVVQTRDGLAAAEGTGAHLLEPYFLGLLGETLAIAGDIDGGIAAIDDALARAAASGQRGTDAELYRLQGALEQRRPQPYLATAEASYRKAIAVAREQGTRGFELRAATSLARLFARQGKRAEAHDLLAPVYDWFAEGFDTQDLKEAKALLDELGGA